jgi:hypothetical protein
MVLSVCLAVYCLLFAAVIPPFICLGLLFLLGALVFPFVGIPATAGEGHCRDCDHRWETAPAPPRAPTSAPMASVTPAAPTAAAGVLRARRRSGAPPGRGCTTPGAAFCRMLGRSTPRGLLDDLGGLEQHVLGDGEAERLGGLEVDHEIEGHRLLHR